LNLTRRGAFILENPNTFNPEKPEIDAESKKKISPHRARRSVFLESSTQQEGRKGNSMNAIPGFFERGGAVRG
jgi:hypothetical protein